MFTTIKKIFKPDLSIEELADIDIPRSFIYQIQLWTAYLQYRGYSTLSILSRRYPPPMINGYLPHIYAEKEGGALLVYLIANPPIVSAKAAEAQAALLKWRREAVYSRGFVQTWPGAGIGGQIDYWGSPLY